MKKIKWIWITVLSMLASLFAFAGCVTVETLEDKIGDNTICVTYYANEGEFSASVYKKDMYHEVGSKVFNVPGVTLENPNGAGNAIVGGPTVKVSYSGYDFVAWHEVELDDSGNPVYLDEAQRIVKAGDPFDFSKVLQEGDRVYLCAVWIKQSQVLVKLVSENGSAITVTEDQADKQYANGDTVRAFNFKNDLVQSTTTQPITPKNGSHTFLAYYADEACTQPVQWPIQRNEDATDIVIYAKYLEGTWTIVRTANQVSDMFNSAGSTLKKFYLANDVDCSGVNVLTAAKFATELKGNGYTIRNLTASRTGVKSETKTALFGEITATAKITDVTFENVTVKVTPFSAQQFSGFEAYFAFTSLATEAQIENVKITGSLLVETTSNMLAANLWKNGDWSAENCKFGGYATDDAFESEEWDVTVSDFVLTTDSGEVDLI
ncbi:MAG: hypothetical protein IJV85_00515 [Clostridia bacterium]|nr:hypothetical protein [Clostridia bacterium]